MLYSREGHGAATVSYLLDSDTSSSKHPSNKDAARYIVSGGFPFANLFGYRPTGKAAGMGNGILQAVTGEVRIL